MIVEFVGLPASGKSTMVKALYEALVDEQKNIICPTVDVYDKPWFRRNIEKAIVVLCYLVRRSAKVAFLVRKLLSYGQKRHFDYWRLTLNNLYFSAIQEECVNSEAIYIFDEGVAHHLWAIELGAKRRLDVPELLRFYHMADVIINVETSDELILKRNEERKSKTQSNNKSGLNIRHMRILSDIALQKKRIRRVLRDIEANYVNYGKPKIITVRNDNFRQMEIHLNHIKNNIMLQRTNEDGKHEEVD